MKIAIAVLLMAGCTSGDAGAVLSDMASADGPVLGEQHGDMADGGADLARTFDLAQPDLIPGDMTACGGTGEPCCNGQCAGNLTCMESQSDAPRCFDNAGCGNDSKGCCGTGYCGQSGGVQLTCAGNTNTCTLCGGQNEICCAPQVSHNLCPWSAGHACTNGQCQ